MLHLIVALAPEARPLIRHLRLKTVATAPGYRLHRGDDIWLVQSGAGRVQAAGATAFLAARSREEAEAPGPTFWLNVGIAGARDEELSTALLAHKITEEATGHRYYPAFPFEIPLPGAELLTVDRPREDLPPGLAVDQEASGFFAVASRFATAECVHALKIVSDNRDHSLTEISPETVEARVHERLDAVDDCLEIGRELVSELRSRQVTPRALEGFLERTRFSATRRGQLEGVLRRLEVLEPGGNPLADCPDELRGAGEILDWLRSRLRACGPPDYTSAGSDRSR